MHLDQWKIQFENQNRLQIDMSDHIHVLAWGHPGRGTATQINLQWNLSITTTQWDTSLPSGAHLGGQGPPRWAPEGRNC